MLPTAGQANGSAGRRLQADRPLLGAVLFQAELEAPRPGEDANPPDLMVDEHGPGAESPGGGAKGNEQRKEAQDDWRSMQMQHRLGIPSSRGVDLGEDVGVVVPTRRGGDTHGVPRQFGPQRRVVEEADVIEAVDRQRRVAAVRTELTASVGKPLGSGVKMTIPPRASRAAMFIALALPRCG